MITIAITTEIQIEIEKEMVLASKRIEKEMAYSYDLRNYESISRDAKFINDMKIAINKGEL